MKNAILILFILFLGLCVLGYTITATKEKKETPIENHVIYDAQKKVRLKLKNPATAKFPSTSDNWIDEKKQDSVIKSVTSYYDAQNDFGALKRGYYTAYYVEKDGKYKIVNLEMN